jgi:hypothetical protein
LFASDLEEAMRKIVLQRIAAGVLTGTSLARSTGFQQGHISNFLRSRRRLSMQGFDLMLAALGISVEHLLERTPDPPERSHEYVEVPVVRPELVGIPDISSRSAEHSLTVRSSSLRKISPRAVGTRSCWRRFIAISADASNAKAMEPQFRKGALLVIDRHYNSLEPYRPQEPNIFAVQVQDSLMIRYVELHHGEVILRPIANDSQLVSLPVPRGAKATDLIVGRVCYVSAEL